MHARTRINFVLFVVAAVLGLALALLPEPRTPRPPPAVDLDPDALESLTLQRLDRPGPVRLERRDGHWAVTTTPEGTMGGDRVARALAALRERTSSCYPAAEQGEQEFGLDPPQATLEAGSVTVEFGYRAPDGRRYIRARGRLCLVEDLTLPILTGKVKDPGSDG